MKKKSQAKTTQSWEIPEIDLNLRHYLGNPSDVIKALKSKINRYLSNSKVSIEKRQIYSAIYNALCYYKDISYLPSAEFKIRDTFLSNCIKSFNEDYKYLAQKYNSSDPSDAPVINFIGRIKSPISFIDKVKEKITEYLEEGRDLSYFNESLRDLIGMRVIVDPPEEIKAQGPQAESDFLYEVYYDLMSHRGITDQKSNNATYKFIPVNTRFHPNKSEEIKNRLKSEGISSDLSQDDIYVPTSRPLVIDDELIDSFLKDYNMYPKFSGYQSLHTCISPIFSNNVEHSDIPSFIIPQHSSDYSFEYQFRTKKQDDFAEHGAASHSFSYKISTPYHRLSVPFYITFDMPDGLPISYPTNYTNKLQIRNFGESFEKFYGVSFDSYFGISFKKFRDIFTSYERNDILGLRKTVVYDKEKDSYELHDCDSESYAPIILSISKKELEDLKLILSSNDSQKIFEFLESHRLSDSIIQTGEDSAESFNPSKSYISPKVSPFKIYILESAEENVKLPLSSKTEKPKNYTNKIKDDESVK